MDGYQKNYSSRQYGETPTLSQVMSIFTFMYKGQLNELVNKIKVHTYDQKTKRFKVSIQKHSSKTNSQPTKITI